MDLWAAATANNAQWCDIVCRGHGVTTAVRDAVWFAGARPPVFYPDAITLTPDVSAGTVLQLIGERQECAVKDSYGRLDLTSEGFAVLFSGQWIQHFPLSRSRSADSSMTAGWTVLTGAAQLAQWSLAHGSSATLTPRVLGNQSVRVLAAWDGTRLAAGAILNLSDGVVGLSNVFATEGFHNNPWACVASAAAALFPGGTLMGYEHDGNLARAVAGDFDVVGELRVWVRTAAADPAGTR